MNSYERVSSLYMKTLFYIIISTLFLFNFSKVKNKNVENLKVSQAKEIKADTLFSKIEFIPLNISNIDSWKTKKSKRYIYIYIFSRKLIYQYFFCRRKIYHYS